MISNFLTIAAISFLLISCAEKNENDEIKREEISLITNIEEVDGVLRVINSKGDVIHSTSNYNSFKYSDNIVAIQYSDKGERVQAYNGNGDLIIDGAELINSYQVGDNIVAIQYYDR